MNQGVTRRQLLLGSAGALTIAASQARASAQSPARPNVLFILADDLGYADLSIYGRADYRTPVLDRLARQGLLMSAGYANSAVCSATRFALITGRYQYRLPSGLFEPGGQTPDYGIPDGHATMPELFRRLGYRTSLIGKWHLGMPPKFSPTQRGYDYFFGFLGGYTDYFRVGGSRQSPGVAPQAYESDTALPPNMALYENEQQVVEAGYLTDVLAARANREITQCVASKTPFFMSLHFNAPHWPWEGPNDLATSKNIANARHSDGGSIRKFGEMVVALDAAIGRVLEKLKSSGVERDTLVVFTSDNGGERFSDTWPFIGAKGELLEGGIRVPLIVRWPARIQPGRRSDQLMMSMDYLPTLLAAAGGSPDPAWPTDGENLLPVLTGQRSPHMRKVYWRYKASEQAVAREGDWKYLKIGAQEFLFNVAEDQRERANLKDRMPDLFARLKQEYGVWNAAMLPYPEGSFSESPRGAWADRY